LKLDKITEAAVEILDRFRHPRFSAFHEQPIEPNDITGREKLAVSFSIRRWLWSVSITSRL
jgi:hypothetical protein